MDASAGLSAQVQVQLRNNMSNPQAPETTMRPEACPECHSKIIETLAKVLNANSLWRCRSCEATWTIASQTAAGPRPR